MSKVSLRFITAWRRVMKGIVLNFRGKIVSSLYKLSFSFLNFYCLDWSLVNENLTGKYLFFKKIKKKKRKER